MKKTINRIREYLHSEEWRIVEKKIDKVIMVLAPILMITIYLLVAFGSSLKFKNYVNVFVYVSLIMSLLLFIVSIFPCLKVFAQRHKGACLVIAIGLSFGYAMLRVKCFPGSPQFEDLGTALLILGSYFVLFNEKK